MVIIYGKHHKSPLKYHQNTIKTPLTLELNTMKHVLKTLNTMKNTINHHTPLP